VTGGVVTKYYSAGSQRIAVHKNGVLNYLLSDHLGPTSLVTDAAGVIVSRQQYKAWGETRSTSGSEVTRYQYTGQYSYELDFGLQFYNARWYDSSLGRFAQAYTIVPGGVQGYDRYAYTNNNPVKYTDPSGHGVDCGIGTGCVKDYSRAKTKEDFRNLPWVERKRWLTEFVHEKKLDTWFDDMIGAIDFMMRNPSLSQKGGTAEVMDAAVLQAINDGWNGDTRGGGQGWADFFAEAKQPSANKNHLIATRLSAEQKGVDYAWNLAGTQSAFKKSGQFDQVFFRSFKMGADSYRSSAIVYRLGAPLSTMAIQTSVPLYLSPLAVAVTAGMTDPRTSGPGLVFMGEVTWDVYNGLIH
jgi:RHS repeat-associated protein